MRFILNKIFLLLLFVVIQLFGQELWQSYKVEVLNSKDSVISGFEFSGICLLINQHTLIVYEKQPPSLCYYKSTIEVDSIKNDSIFSSSFLSRKEGLVRKVTHSLYYSGNNLIWFEVDIFDIGDTSIVKSYFKRVDLSLEQQLTLNLCSTSTVRKINPKSEVLYRDQFSYSLLGQKVNTLTIRRSQTINVVKCKKEIGIAK